MTNRASLRRVAAVVAAACADALAAALVLKFTTGDDHRYTDPRPGQVDFD
jgi:hypothetical protein